MNHALVGMVGLMVPALCVQAERIRLTTGETLEVTVQEVSEHDVRAVHPVLGELRLTRSSVVLLDRSSGDIGAKHAAEPSPEPSLGALETSPQGQAIPVETEEPPPPPPPEWKFKFVLAAAGASGNTENASFTTLITGVREAPRTKAMVDAGYFFGSSDGDRSQNRFTVGGRHDWLNPESKWFYFADARYDLDEFQSWDSRVNSHVGLGYRLITPPKLTLNLLAGIGLVKEWGSENDDVRPEALFGVEGKYDFSDKHSIKFDSTVFPDLKDTGEYRWLSNVGWSFLLDSENNLSLTAGVQHEYQSVIEPGREHNDIRAFAGLQFDF